jgi:hypothetical protein
MTHSGTNSKTTKPISVLRPAAKVEELVESSFVEDLIVAAGHGVLNEDLALAMLQRRDLPSRVLEALIRNHAVMKHRKVLLQVVQHPRTPRHISLPLLRRLFVFELMHVALEPAVAADLKLLAEDVLIDKLETLSFGECINLARRASPAVAGALLLHGQRQVIQAALQNPRMTEASIAKSLAKAEVSPLLLSMLVEHPKWSTRRELQLAIVRRSEATDAIVLKAASKLPKAAILEVIEHVRLPEPREQLLRTLLEEP